MLFRNLYVVPVRVNGFLAGGLAAAVRPQRRARGIPAGCAPAPLRLDQPPQRLPQSAGADAPVGPARLERRTRRGLVVITGHDRTQDQRGRTPWECRYS